LAKKAIGGIAPMECRGIILNLTAETHRAKRVIIFYFVAESLVLWARSEMIGSAICPIYAWFQVSGKNES
jgi:hypothetical protein